MTDDQPMPYDTKGFRYAKRSFPRYRHLPGVTPHPRRDPQGHHFGQKEIPPERFDPASWRFSEDYLYGVDLYNFAYFWEAHEAWEGLWKTTGRDDLPGLFLQGLIQVSAALLKREQGKTVGMKNLSRQALAKLRLVAEVHRNYCGVDLVEFINRMEKIFAAAARSKWTDDPRIHLRGTSQ